MPNYPGVANSMTLSPTPPVALYPGDSFLAFSSEQPVAGQASVAFTLPIKDGGPAAGIAVDIDYAAPPGAANIQVQESGFDADASYQTPAAATYTITAFVVKGALSTANANLIPFGSLFGRILYSAIGNNVAVRIRVTRVS